MPPYLSKTVSSSQVANIFGQGSSSSQLQCNTELEPNPDHVIVSREGCTVHEANLSQVIQEVDSSERPTCGNLAQCQVFTERSIHDSM